jgi:hypothetical protein
MFFFAFICAGEFIYFNNVALATNDAGVLWNLYLFLLCPILMVSFSYFVGVWISVLVFPTIYGMIERMNGGPFKVGDTVLILSKKHLGKRGVIYEMWQGVQFRVDIGDEYKEKFMDIFNAEQVVMCDATQQCNSNVEPDKPVPLI